MSYREEIRRIYQDEGMKGFSRGYSGMLLRDGPGFALYFCMFEALKRQSGVTNDNSTINEGFQIERAAKTFVSGGLAGITTWIAVYPFDTVKSKM
jgi:solute carrier family 25 carnitine/acylcarnitine transporter 20/29